MEEAKAIDGNFYKQLFIRDSEAHVYYRDNWTMSAKKEEPAPTIQQSLFK